MTPPNNQLDLVDISVIRSFSHLELGHWIVGLAEALAVHPGHQGENAFPRSTVSGSSELKACGSAFIEVTLAAETDLNQRAKRDAMRPEVELEPIITLQWIGMRVHKEKDPSLFHNLPIRLKQQHKTTKGTGTTVTAPQNVKVKHGPRPGTVLVSCGKVPGAVVYHVSFCQGDPANEPAWVKAQESRGCRGILVEGLTPGAVYHFRVMCYGTGGYSACSAVASLRIL